MNTSPELFPSPPPPPLEYDWERRWTKLLTELAYLVSSGAFVSEGELTERLQGVISQDENEAFWRSRLFAVVCLLAAENTPSNLLHSLTAQALRRLDAPDNSTKLAVERMDNALNYAMSLLQS